MLLRKYQVSTQQIYVSDCPGKNLSVKSNMVLAYLHKEITHISGIDVTQKRGHEKQNIMKSFKWLVSTLQCENHIQRRNIIYIFLLMGQMIYSQRLTLSQPVPPPTFLNPIPNFRTFHSYVPTSLCFIFIQPCLFPICIFHLTPWSLLPHDLMFHLNLSLIPFVFIHMSYPLVHYIDPDLIDILLHSIKDM